MRLFLQEHNRNVLVAEHQHHYNVIFSVKKKGKNDNV